jgi:hypothetical protein
METLMIHSLCVVAQEKRVCNRPRVDAYRLPKATAMSRITLQLTRKWSQQLACRLMSSNNSNNMFIVPRWRPINILRNVVEAHCNFNLLYKPY